MKPLPQISEAEFEVMKIVWNHAPVSTNEITERLVKTTAWSPRTIQTLVRRLVNKGVLTYEKQGRVFVYTPLVEEQAYLNQENHSFLLSACIENDQLSREDLQKLRSLLDESSDEKR